MSLKGILKIEILLVMLSLISFVPKESGRNLKANILSTGAAIKPTNTN